MSLKLSKQEIVKEIVKSGKDPVYFINNYCRISHPLRGLIPFNTYPYQDDLIKDFNDYRFNIILKARQLGISTISAAYAVWFMLFHKEKNILVMATKFTTAANLVKKVKQVMKNLPPWMQVAKITIDNRNSFELSNGSTIKAVGTSPDAGRSEALSLLIIDEAAHVEGLGELWAGLYPTLSTGGRCIALSTPMGVGNWFHKTYIDAENGDNEFHTISLPWHVHPERDQAWFEKETKNMARRQIAQELECNFNTSGETVIHPDDIAWMHEQICEPEYRTGFDRNFWIWEKYQEGLPYLLVADVARGDGADSSVFHIVRTDTMEIVAEYQGKPTLDHYASILNDAGREYGNCLLVVENVGIGISVCEKLKDLEYPNLYYSIKGTHEYVDAVTGEYNNNAVIGFTTSSKTRPLIVAKLEEYVRNKLIKPRSQRLFSEVKTFIWNNGKPQAMRSYHDDLIMSLAIACWVRDTALETSQRDLEYKRAMLDGIYCKTRTINTSIKGMQEHKARETFEEKYEKEIKVTKDFAWIFKG
tara:strand:- start:1343 stop:2932 length:1590 start_codon:yes stop_codon:yes gene_type:complete